MSRLASSHRERDKHTLRNVFATALLAGPLAACMVVPLKDRAILHDPVGGTRITSLACGDRERAETRADAGALDPEAISLVTWNIHKNADPGWDADLAHFVAGHDLVLLQEVRVTPALRAILAGAGHGWTMASAFELNGRDTGVLTAARASPVTACTLSELEPILQTPKAAVVTHHRLAGRPETLAVVNIHSINIVLTTGAYRAQLDAVAAVLERHAGPIVFAGDLNTWASGRRALVERMAARLGLAEVKPSPDGRRRFFGNQVDYVFVRGLEAVSAVVIEVTSSDHHPVSTRLRLER